MVGIVVISHGPFAHAIVESAKFFLGEIKQIRSVELKMEDDPSCFKKKIKEACQSVDFGDGAVILADLFGGTPCNQAALLMNEKIHVLSGCNLSMLLEICTMRLNKELDLDALVHIVKDGICHINRYYEEEVMDDDEA